MDESAFVANEAIDLSQSGVQKSDDRVLLLDDAFSELDEATATALVQQLPPGQAVLTTAGPVPGVLGDVDLSLNLRDGILEHV